nr:hypothetical protein [Tanacetum cinerariifolium]
PVQAARECPYSEFLKCKPLDFKGSESIPEADIPLQKRARFTTPTNRYEIGDSSVAARQIRPTLTIAESRRADVTQMEALRREVSTLQRQNIEHAQRAVAPKDGDSCS